jgi:hypothetical protein
MQPKPKIYKMRKNIMAEKTDLKIAEPEVEEDDLSYSQHMDNAESLCDELNGILRTRFHRCEALVITNWQGVVVLSRSVMTSAPDANGKPVHLNLNVPLRRPWMDRKEDRLEPADVLAEGLAIAEDAMTGQCAKMGVLRINYQTFVKRMSTTIAVPVAAVPKLNGKSRILLP